MGVDIAQDQIQIGLVAQHDVVEQLQAELGELDPPAAHLFDLPALLFGDPFGQTARDRGAGVHLAPADDLDDRVAVLARLDHLAADLQPHLVDHAQDIALCDGRIRSHHKIRSGEGIEMGGVVGEVEAGIEQLAQLLGRRGRVDMVDRIGCLGRRHMVRFGAHAADAVGQQRHLLHRAADAEALEAAQLGDLEIGVGHFALFVEENFDLAVAFKAGDGVDTDFLHHGTLLALVGLAVPGGPGGSKQRACQIETIELSGGVGDAVQDLVDLIRVVAVDHRGKGRDQPRPVILNALSRAVAADALRPRLRAERAAAAAGRRTVARDPLFQQAEVGVDRAQVLDAPEALDELHVALARAFVAHGRIARPDHRALGRQGRFALQHLDHQIDHRRDLVRLRRAAGHVVVHIDHLVQGAQHGEDRRYVDGAFGHLRLGLRADVVRVFC